MALSSAERQAAYWQRRINTWVATASALALERLARHHGISQRAMLEQLISAADERITKRLDPTSPAWAAYFSVTR